MDIELNVWYKCIVYSFTLKYIKFSCVEKNNIEGDWIQNTNYYNDGGWNEDSIIEYISVKELKPLEYELINDLFDSGDSSNIIIALTIINKI